MYATADDGLRVAGGTQGAGAPGKRPRYRPQELGVHALYGGEISQYEPVPDSGIDDRELARKHIHAYYASTSYAVAQVGRVLTALDRLGLVRGIRIDPPEEILADKLCGRIVSR